MPWMTASEGSGMLIRLVEEQYAYMHVPAPHDVEGKTKAVGESN